MLKEKFSILSAGNLIFFFSGIFLACCVIFVWFFLKNRPLNYTYISRPLGVAIVTVVPTTPAIVSPPAVQGIVTAKININSASLSDLDKLPGIGPARAQDIVDGRPYQRIEDLLIKKAISRSVYEQIKEKISVE